MLIPFTFLFCIHFKLTVADTNISGSDEHRIYRHILAGYNKFVRPVTNINHTIYVKTNPALYSVLNTDEAKETITVKQWMRLFWNDEFLRWNPAEFGGLEEIMVPLSQIWVPDLVIYGTVDVSLSIPADKTLADVSYLGNIGITMMERAHVDCTYHIQEFPFDTQNCSFHFGSWKYNGRQVHWETMKPYGDTKYFKPHTEWSLLSYNGTSIVGTYPNSPNIPYTEVCYHVILRRKPLYYIFTMILPSYMITTLSVVGLFTPFSATGERQEKISMALTTLLAMAVLLIMIADQMPKTSIGLPMIVGIMYIHHLSAYGHAVPNILRKITCLPITESPQKSSFRLFQDKPKASSDDPSLVLQLRQCNMQIQEIRKHLENMEEDSVRLMEWMRVCDRLDFFMLILMLVVNTVFTFGIYVFVKFL